MTFYFSFIPHAAKAEPIKFSAHGFGNRTANRGFSNPGRPNKEHDRSGNFLFIGTHSEKLYNTFLHVIETVMIPIKNLSCLLYSQLVFGINAPGNYRHPLKVISCYCIFLRSFFQIAEFFQFIIYSCGNCFRRFEFFQTLLKFFGIRFSIIFGYAQFTLDGLQLLTQEEFSLTLTEFCIYIFTDFTMQFSNLNFLMQKRKNTLHPLKHRQCFQNLL